MADDIITRLQALPKGSDDSVFSEEEKAFIGETYKAVFGSPVRVCSCRSRFSDAVMELYAALKIKRKDTRRYRLNAGVMIFHEAEYYTDANLTDEVAAAYLEKHPDAASVFTVHEVTTAKKKGARK